MLEGRETGTTELRIDLHAEGPGSNPFRIYQLPGRSEIWIDVEWLRIPEEPMVAGLGELPFVKSVHAKAFPSQEGGAGLGRIVVEVDDARSTGVRTALQGRTSQSIVLVFGRSIRNALLSPDREAHVKRSGRATLGSGVIAGTRRAPPPAGTVRPVGPSKATRYANALDAAPIVLVAKAISDELRTLDALPPDTTLGDGGFPGGGRVTFQIEKVVRGQAPDVVVLEIPMCRPKPAGADCLTPEELAPFTKKRVILFLSDESLSPRLDGRVEESLWLLTAKRARLFLDVP